VQVNLTSLGKLIRNEVASEHLDLQIISGADCNARTIISKVRLLGRRVKAGDSIFCHYSGHGAFDPRFAANDPAGGHFFQIPNGDLMRKTLFDNLLAQPGRLKALVTDTCNVQAVARPAGRLSYEQSTVVASGPTPLEQLLLYHRGYLDVSATSRGNSAGSTTATAAGSPTSYAGQSPVRPTGSPS
jgi:hypothetical protein